MSCLELCHHKCSTTDVTMKCGKGQVMKGKFKNFSLLPCKLKWYGKVSDQNSLSGRNSLLHLWNEQKLQKKRTYGWPIANFSSSRYSIIFPVCTYYWENLLLCKASTFTNLHKCLVQSFAIAHCCVAHQKYMGGGAGRTDLIVFIWTDQ